MRRRTPYSLPSTNGRSAPWAARAFIDLVHVRVVRKVEVARKRQRPWPRRKIEDRIVVFTPLLTPTSLPWKGWRFCSEKGVPRKCRYLRSRGLSLFRGMSSIGSMQPICNPISVAPGRRRGSLALVLGVVPRRGDNLDELTHLGMRDGRTEDVHGTTRRHGGDSCLFKSQNTAGELSFPGGSFIHSQ